ncbi:hypothetical protein IMY05_009G0049500 [Salix suchowensis]|nr:hypothetical protein IMY05_009G0049500 [Salix suchowensis]
MEFATMKLFAAAVVVAAMLASAAVSAQDFGEPAPAPAPGMDKGAASFSSGTSGALICSSLFFSMLALLRH